MSTMQDLADATRQMREAQVWYFNTRDRDALRKSKALEARVDQLLDALDPATPTQSSFLGVDCTAETERLERGGP